MQRKILKFLTQAFIYFLGCTLLLLIVLIEYIAFWSHEYHKNSVQTKEYIQKEYLFTKEGLTSLILNSKLLPARYKPKSIRYLTFTIENGSELFIHHEYIHHNPIEPDGKIPFLILKFYLPHMESRKEMESQFSFADKKILQEVLDKLTITTLVTRLTKKILHPRQELFNAAIKDFQKPLGKIKNQSDSIQPLKNGKHDNTLNLVAYSGSKKIRWGSDVPILIHTIYLKPEEDISNPQEWIMRGDDLCIQCWLVDGYYVEVMYISRFLPMHALIHTKINQKLDEFSKPTPFHKIKKGILDTAAKNSKHAM